MTQAGPWYIDALANTSLSIHNTEHAFFQIMSGADALVKISMKDGSLTFGPNYSPDAAAKVFWEAVSDDYRKMLKWQSEHPEAG